MFLIIITYMYKEGAYLYRKVDRLLYSCLLQQSAKTVQHMICRRVWVLLKWQNLGQVQSSAHA